jgi:hypothetical protein
LTAGVAAASVGLVAAAGGFGDDGPVLCPVRNLTGGYCPGCGLGRACGALANGDVSAALSYHPFAPLLLLQAVVIGGLLLFGSPAAGRWLWNRLAPLVVANGGALAALWVGRLLTGAIPAPFGA